MSFWDHLKQMFHTLFGFGGETRSERGEARFNTEHLNADGLSDYELFVERNEELGRSLKALRIKKKPLIIEGKSGIGKTSLLTVLERRFLEIVMRKDKRKLRISEIGSEVMSPNELVRRIAENWEIKIDHEDRDPLEVASEIGGKLDPSNEHLLLVEAPEGLSAIPEERTEISGKVLRNLLEVEDDRGEPKISFVLTGLPTTLNTLSLEQAEIPNFEKINLKPLDSEDFTDYLEKYLAYSGLNPNFMTTSAKEKIYERSEGVPGLVNSAIEKVIQSLPGEGPTPRIDDEYIEEIL